MKEKLDLIYQYIDNNKENILELYREFVNIESCGREPESVNVFAERLKSEFEKEGFICKLVDVGGNGKTLVGILGDDRQGEPVIFSGHMDTALRNGTFGKDLFKIVDGKIYGPGVLDMKGGIIISLYVIKALNSIGYNERPIKIVYSGDEEVSHMGSNGAEIILEEAKGGICAFNMETGLIDNSLCVGRKGRIEAHISVEGIEAHAGNDFSSGINAIEEVAYKTIAFRKLTNLEIGTTFNVGKIDGGTIANAVPKECKIELDVRFEKMDEMSKIKENIIDVCEKTYVPGTKTKCEFVGAMNAYETTEGVMNFYNYVNETAQEFGFEKLNSRKLGGVSDAAYVTIAGTPVICSFGIRGEWNHTVREYALVESLFERSKLIAAVIMNLKKLTK
ncbi:M20 family metallopeptidase [Clostridium sp. D2Q-14]|uniref:M20 family metallopeptidase n=1 Tax=Anaeromonas gelatinilytica TaxID=2683194 RepID=UPI00193B3BE0|nr:M20 family metallopeptidase [Anaeromonas gelatinilytica]MBS4536471.1 M20 family metallopeptidase [Anaeromonas gelatinilytica]